MNFTREQVEAITQRVIQQLRNKGVAVGPRHSSIAPPDSAARHFAAPGRSIGGGSTSASLRSVAIEVRSRIITEDTLVAANAAGRTVSMSSEAVLTPSARDYIRQTGIQVIRSNSTTADPVQGIAIVSNTNTTLQSALNSTQWSVVSATTDFQVAAAAARKQNAMMVCSVQQPSLAACLLNRSTLFRAAVINPADNFVALQQSMSPNVVCLNPTGWSIAGLMALLKEFTAPPQQAADWKEIPD